MIFRSTIGKFTGINWVELVDSIASMEKSLNDMVNLKQKILTARNNPTGRPEDNEKHRIKVNKVDIAIQTISNE
jgi:hypothetical protein